MFYRNFGQSSQLINAILSENLKLVMTLLKKGENPNHADEQGWLPLHAALAGVPSNKSLEFVQALVDSGAEVNAWDLHRNETPLLTACEVASWETIEYLLKKGADPNVIRSDGASSLSLGVQRNHLLLVETLLQKGGTKWLNRYGGLFGLTPLGLAASLFNVKMIELLLLFGADAGVRQEFDELAQDKLPPRDTQDPQIWDYVKSLLKPSQE